MRTAERSAFSPAPAAPAEPLARLLEQLELGVRGLDGRREAALVESAASGAVAVVVIAGDSLADDTDAIETIKEIHASLPIIYVAGTSSTTREQAIRRLGIHYFLADPEGTEELRLVLEALMRSTRVFSSFERFFTS